MAHNLFADRMRAMREDANLTQEALAARLGFKDRQTVSAIETGERRLSAEELLRVVQVFGTTVEAFSDPFVLMGNEGRFSWRQSNAAPDDLTEFEGHAGQWVATYRGLASQLGIEPPLLRPTLNLSKKSSFEDAAVAGERFAAAYDLGEVPATRLVEVMEQLGILVLMVDALPKISGAACRLSDLDAVLINRTETDGRRHFDLAHELFHVLTWEAMPPEHVEDAAETSRARVEQLANSFASAVLMPSTVVARFGAWRGMDIGAITSKLNQTADALSVTASALKWRLVVLNILPGTVARQIPESSLRNNGCAAPVRQMPAPFSRQFMRVLARALDEGLMSARRAAGLLDVTIDDLPDLAKVHGIQLELDL